MFKTLIQLFLVLTLFLILSIVFYKYFYDQPENKIIKEIETEKIVKDTVISEDKKDSVIYNLSVKSLIFLIMLTLLKPMRAHSKKTQMKFYESSSYYRL